MSAVFLSLSVASDLGVLRSGKLVQPWNTGADECNGGLNILLFSRGAED